MKAFRVVVTGFVALVAVLGGCSKDSSTSNPAGPGTTTPALSGSWTVINGANDRVHMVFKSDNTYAFLDKYAYGLRAVESGVYQVDGSTVDFGNSQQPSIFSFSIRNDTLTLYNPQQVVVSYRNASAPSDTQWVKRAAILDSIIAPTRDPTDIAINGNTLWYGNTYDANHLYKIDLTNRTVDSSLTVSVSAWALEWDGTNLWASDDGSGSVYKINTTTGATTFTSKTMGAWIEGIAWDGTALWCSSWNEESLYRYNPATDAVLTTLPLGGQPSGLAYAGGYLFVVVNGVINKCTPAPFAVAAAYSLKGLDILGIAFDGANFWITGSSNTEAKIYKVALQ